MDGYLLRHTVVVFLLVIGLAGCELYEPRIPDTGEQDETYRTTLDPELPTHSTAWTQTIPDTTTVTGVGGEVYKTYRVGDGFPPTNVLFDTMKFDGVGNLLWRRAHSPANVYATPALSRDTHGDLYLLGSEIVKYDSDGTVQWSLQPWLCTQSACRTQWTDLQSTAEAVYVTGYMEDGDNGYAVITAAVGLDGQVKWGHARHFARYPLIMTAHLTIDSNDNIIVGATLAIPEHDTKEAAVVLTYNAQGASRWTVFPAFQYVHHVAADPYGGIIVAGDDGLDYVMERIAADGDLHWHRTLPDVTLNSLMLDHAANIYAVGTRECNYDYRQGSLCDVLTVKYDVDGKRLWARRNNSGAADSGKGLLLAIAGGVYSRANLGGTDYVIYYNTNGVPQWKALYQPPWYPVWLSLTGSSG